MLELLNTYAPLRAHSVSQTLGIKPRSGYPEDMEHTVVKIRQLVESDARSRAALRTLHNDIGNVSAWTKAIRAARSSGQQIEIEWTYPVFRKTARIVEVHEGWAKGASGLWYPLDGFALGKIHRLELVIPTD